jgi:hypothetical protein
VSTCCTLRDVPKDPELLHVLEVAPSSLEDSSRAMCRDGDPLCTIPMNMALESHSWGERLRRPRLPKRMVLHGSRQTPVRFLPLAMNESFSEGTIRMSRGKPCYKSPFLPCQLSVFFASARTGWSRSHGPILRWSCELQSTL